MLRKKNNNTKTYAVLGLMAAPAVVSGMVLSASFVSANDSVVDTITAVVPASCTMSGSGMTSHSANVSSGTYTSDIGTTTMNVVCNDTAGFSIYAAGFTGNTVGGANSNKLVGTAASGNAAIDTGTAEGPGYSGDVSNWAMKLDTDYYATYPIEILNDYDYYHAVPNSFTKVATRLTGTDAGTGATGATLTSSYAVYVSKAQPADTYTGLVKYVLVHPNTAPEPQSVPLGDAIYMQDAIDLENTPAGTTKTLIDSRDSQSYIVGKAADGNIWMLQDMKLGKTTDSMTLTAATSDVSNNFVLNNKLSDGRFHAYTVDGEPYQNNNSEYYCTEDYGCYYNWYTATAGTGTTYISTSQAQATASICPAGWALPSQPQFSALYSSYPSATLMEVDNPTTTKENTTGKIPGFLLNGYYYKFGANDLGSYGSYWSRSAYSAQDAYYLDLNTSGVYPASYVSKYLGFAVRCVLE